jgi:hypothetical protein
MVLSVLLLTGVYNVVKNYETIPWLPQNYNGIYVKRHDEFDDKLIIYCNRKCDERKQ